MKLNDLKSSQLVRFRRGNEKLYTVFLNTKIGDIFVHYESKSWMSFKDFNNDMIEKNYGIDKITHIYNPTVPGIKTMYNDLIWQRDDTN